MRRQEYTTANTVNHSAFCDSTRTEEKRCLFGKTTLFSGKL